jgi:F420-dependent oxidoreductase-like protein
MFRLGLLLASISYGLDSGSIFSRVQSVARAADENGFDSIWAPDHMLQGSVGGGPNEPMLESYTFLGALAVSTEHVRLGALVSPVTFRPPALLAKSVTTLDVISGGRAVLGLGAAWDGAEHAAYGLPFPTMGERQDRLEETAQLCRLMLTQPVSSFTGEHYSIEGAILSPRPVQARVPILIAGGGERRTLRSVARYADACNLAGSPDQLRHKLDVLDGHCADAGRDRSEIVATCIVEPPASTDELLTAVGERLAAGADGMVLLGNRTPDAETVAGWGASLSSAFPQLARG